MIYFNKYRLVFFSALLLLFGLSTSVFANNPCLGQYPSHNYKMSHISNCGGTTDVVIKEKTKKKKKKKGKAKPPVVILEYTYNITRGMDGIKCTRCNEVPSGSSGVQHRARENDAEVTKTFTQKKVVVKNTKCFRSGSCTKTSSCIIQTTVAADPDTCFDCEGKTCTRSMSLWDFIDNSLRQEIPLMQSNSMLRLSLLNYSNLSARQFNKINNLGGQWSLSIAESLVQYKEDDIIVCYRPQGGNLAFVKEAEDRYVSSPSGNYLLTVNEGYSKLVDHAGNTKTFGPFISDQNNEHKVANITKIMKRNSPVVLIKYNSNNQMEGVSLGAKNNIVYQILYNTDNRISGIQDVYGNKIASFVYNTDERLASVYYGDSLDANNPHYTFTYNSHGKIIEKIRPNFGVVKYEYDKSGILTKAIDANGFYISRTRKNDQVTVSNSAGNNSEIVINPGYRNFAEAKYASGKVVNQKINVFGLITEKTGDCSSCDGSASITKYKYNDNNQRTQIDYYEKDILVASEFFKYDERNNRIAYIDRSGNETKYEYDAEDKEIATIFPDGSKKQVVYDQRGNVIARIDESGNKTSYKFDKIGNMVKEIFADGSNKRSKYDRMGRKIEEYSPDGDLTGFRYNTLGYMIERVGPVGDLTHDGSVDNEDLEAARTAGDFETWAKDTKGNPLSYTDPNGNTTRYEYDGQWQLIKTIYPDGAFEQLFRDGEGRVIKKLGRDGTYIFTKYDPGGKVLESIWDTGDKKGVIDSNDPRTKNRYSNTGQLIAAIDCNGNITSYEYDTFGRRVKTIDALGNETSVKYEGGNLASSIDALGRVTRYGYDSRNRMISQILPDGRETNFEYDAVGNQTKIVKPSGSITINKFDDMNRLIETIEDADNMEVVTEHVYNKDGQRIASIRDKGVTNLTTKYEYDAKGRLASIISPDGIKQQMLYDNMGNVIENATEAAGLKLISSKSYDIMNRPTEIISVDGKVTRVLYDESGHRFTMAVDPEGLNIQTRYDYNYLGKVTKTINDFNGDEESVSLDHYDAQGNLIAMIDGSGIKTDYKYDQDNQLIKTINALGFVSETKYDKDGRVKVVVDQNGRSKMTSYNKIGQVIEQINEMQQPVKYTYNAAGNRLTLEDANGNISKWEYDSLERPISLTYPNGDKEIYAYDRLSRMTSKTKPDGSEIKFEYDQGSRITKIFTDQGMLEFKYDVLGRKVEEIDNTLSDGEAARVTYKYSDTGKLLEKIDHHLNQSVNYTYNVLGQKTSMIKGEMRVTYKYNRRGLLSEVQKDGEEQPTRYSYDKAGRRTKISLLNGVNTDYTYDKAGRLIAVISRNNDGAVISGTEFTLDKTGNRVTMKLTLDGKVTNIKYTFDDAYRLTGEYRTNEAGEAIFNEEFTYDVLGNRVKSVRVDVDNLLNVNAKDSLTQIESKYNNANQITERKITYKDGSVNAEKYSYDKNGNTVKITTTDGTGKIVKSLAMSYDWLNRQILWSSTEGDKTVSEKQIYRGNEWKRIATITDDGKKKTTVKYLYDGDNVVADFDAENKLLAEYVTPILDENLSMTRGKDTYYYTQDGLGSVRTLTDVYGKVVTSNDYLAFGSAVPMDSESRDADSFGKPQSEVKRVQNRYTYTGRESSTLASVDSPMYYRWRMYNADVGRFGKRDPIGYNDGGVIYLYVDADPINNIDPTGLVVSPSSPHGNFGWIISGDQYNPANYLVTIRYFKPTFSNWKCEDNGWLSSKWQFAQSGLGINGGYSGAGFSVTYRSFWAQAGDDIYEYRKYKRYKKYSDSNVTTGMRFNLLQKLLKDDKVESWYDSHHKPFVRNIGEVYCSETKCKSELNNVKNDVITSWFSLTGSSVYDTDHLPRKP